MPNQTPPDRTTDLLTVSALLIDAARQAADRDLIVTPVGRLSYEAADQLSRHLAGQMVAAGVGKGSRVGILLPNGIEWALSWLAAARIGALTLPLSTYLEPPELAGILRHGDIQVLVTAPSVLGRDYLERIERAVTGLSEVRTPGPHYLPSVPSLRRVWTWGRADREWAICIDDLDQGPGSDVLAALEAAASPADALAVIHTSGSTAQPKGVIHTSGGLLRHARRVVEQAHPLVPADRVYSPNPFFWVGGLVHVLLGVLHARATALVEPSFDAQRTFEFVRRERMTVFLGQPHARAALLEAARRAGEPLVGVRMQHLRSLGMTETAGSHVAAPRAGSDSFGTPVAGVDHRIVDETGDDVPDGSLGEIWVRGEDVCVGLLRRERTEVFDADGWYHTGDWGWFDGGELYFAGRRTEMIKTKGMNVAPREVELAIETLPWAQQAIVVGLDDPRAGQIVGAMIARAADADPPEDVSSSLKGLLSSYKIPRRISVVDHHDIPLLASGKVDKREVARRLQAGEG